MRASEKYVFRNLDFHYQDSFIKKKEEQKEMAQNKAILNLVLAIFMQRVQIGI